MKKTQIATAGLLGIVFAGLTDMMVNSPDRIGAIAVFLAPGFILAIAASGNVHAFRTSVAAIGNLIFYFGLILGCMQLWEKYRTRHNAQG